MEQGCGDGRWLAAIADIYGCPCWGVDIDTDRFLTRKSSNVAWFIMYTVIMSLLTIILPTGHKKAIRRDSESIFRKYSSFMVFICCCVPGSRR